MLKRLKRELQMFRQGRRFERELGEEIEFHLEMKKRDLMEAGLSEREATRLARIEFGNVALVREDSRAPWLRSRVDEISSDTRYACRWLFRHPVFTISVILTLALGIGANSAVFSLLDALLIRVPAVERPDQLVFVGDSVGSGVFQGVHTRHMSLLSMPMVKSLAARQDRFDGVASMASYTSPLYLPRGDALERLDVRLVSGDFFRVLGIGASQGRILEPADDLVGNQPTMVLSHAAWQRHFSGSPDVLGRTVVANGQSLVIVGVAPRGFHGLVHGRETEAWVPMAFHPQILSAESRAEREDIAWLRMFGRLSPGVSREGAAERLTFLFQERALEEWGGTAPEGVDLAELKLSVRSLAEGPSTLRQSYARPVALLMAVVGIVLLIACANVANLLLARASARRHELTTRVALGAGRRRLVRQLLTEGAVLAACGGALGLLFAYLGVRALLSLFAEGEGEAFLAAGLDLRVILFTALISVTTVLLFGLAPALKGAGLGSASAARIAGTRASRPSLRSLGSWLVIAQVALCLVLLVLAGLFLRTLENLHHIDSGMSGSVLMARIDPSGAGFAGEARQQLYRDLVGTAESLPEVQFASVSTYALFTGDKWLARAFPQGVELEENERVVQADLIGGHHFETLDVALLEGRRFNQGDRADSAPVAIVNQTYADKFFPEDGALGSRVGFGSVENSGDVEVVGIVADAKYHSLREETPAVVYVPITQEDEALECLTVRTVGNPEEMISQLRHEWARAAPNLPILDFRTLPQQIDRSLKRERLIGRLSTLFGALALLLSALGLYAVLAYSVAGRVRELGLRIAVGASRAEIVRLVLRDALLLVLVGMALGLPAALFLGRFASGLLFGLNPSDPLTVAVSIAILVAAGALSSYLPARRAASLDPVTALRAE